MTSQAAGVQMTRQRTLAVLLAPRKLSKLPLAELCKAHGHDILLLNQHNWRAILLSAPIIDTLVHKLADFTTVSQPPPSETTAQDNTHSSTQLFCGYKELVADLVAQQRILRVVDGFEGMEMLQNRWWMLQEMEAAVKGSGLRVPFWSLRLQDVTASGCAHVIAKPMDACGAPNSHLMQLLIADQQCGITSFSGNQSNNSSARDNEYVYQEFIPHRHILYKVYVIGRHVDVVMRASIGKDIFQSHGQFEYGVTVGKAQLWGTSQEEALLPHMGDVRAFVERMRQRFGLSLFGVDVIVSEDTAEDVTGRKTSGDAYVIDVNYFPGFDGVVDLAGKLGRVLFLPDSDSIDFQ